MKNNKQNNRSKAHYIHRLTYSAQEKLAGTFVLIAVGLLVWLLITSQKTQNLFEDEITLSPIKKALGPPGKVASMECKSCQSPSGNGPRHSRTGCGSAASPLGTTWGRPEHERTRPNRLMSKKIGFI